MAKREKSIGVSKTRPVNEARPLGTKKEKASRKAKSPDMRTPIGDLPKTRRGAAAEKDASVKESAKLAPALADSALTGGSPTKETVAAAETLAEAQKVLDPSPESAVSSSSSNVAPVSAPTTNSNQEKKIMDVTLTRGKVSKSGKKAQYRSAALVRAVVLPAALFAAGTFPETVTMSADFATLGADEQSKAEARNAARVAKGLKPKATPAELAAREAARIAKLQAKLDKANARAAKLAGKNAPATAASEPAAENASA